MEGVIIFKNNDLNNLLNDYCQVNNIVKVNKKCQIIKFHKEVYNEYKQCEYNYYISFFEINKNIPTCRHYIKTYIKDIRRYNEIAFINSCYNGHLEVVKFLWSLNQGINIHVDNEYAFEWSCANGHIEVVKFLIALYKQENNTDYLEILNQYPNIKSKIITLP